ncbi:MAG: hypothetical protein ACTSR8_00970 [Promethearchaeota archaeon]
MNLLKSLLFCIILLLSADLYCQIGNAALQDHLSFNANDEFTWTAKMDKEGLEAFEDDFAVPEDYSFNKDLHGFKIEISSIEKEKEQNGSKVSEIEIHYYENENSKEADWELSKDKSETMAYAYEKEVYAEGEFLLKLIYGAVLFIPDNVDWKEVAKEAEKNLETDVTLDKFEIHALDAGLELMLKYEDTEELKLSIEYSSAGVLSAYKLEYNDQLVMESTLETLIIPWEIIVGFIILIAAIIVGVYVFIIRPRLPLREYKEKSKKTKKHKKPKSAPSRKDNKRNKKSKKNALLKRSRPLSTRNKLSREVKKSSPSLVSSKGIEPEGFYEINMDVTEKMKDFLGPVELHLEEADLTLKVEHSSTKSISNKTPEESAEITKNKKLKELYAAESFSALLIGNSFNRPYGKYAINIMIGRFTEEQTKESFTALRKGIGIGYYLVTEHEMGPTELYWIEDKKSILLKRSSDTPFQIRDLFSATIKKV